jgi:hypothetical protein
MTLLVATLMLAASVALFVAAPLADFVARRSSEQAGPDTARLEHERNLAIAALRDLEFDHAMGKIADSEFRLLRTQLENRALATMAELAPGGTPSRAGATAADPTPPIR